MKDWKAEYDKLRGQYAELQKQLDYERRNREDREYRANQVQETFKQLLIEVLGK